MPPREPGWWYEADGVHDGAQLWPRLLAPVAALYGWAAARRFAKASPYRAPLPVICVGNFTAGGTGKTPTALFIAGLIQRSGRRPAFLTRGYTGRLTGPVLVDPTKHAATDVGDEPLLLAASAATIVSRDRPAGARAIAALDPRPDAIIMDDGLQNPTLAKDLTIAVVDASRGFGNGRVIPAGPLRADLGFQLGLADAVLVNGRQGDGTSSPAGAWLRHNFHGPVLEAELVPVEEQPLAGRRVVAFAGIANPQRFRRTLAQCGADVKAFLPFPDHHAFTAAECRHLLTVARGAGADLVTTEKDWVRLGTSTEEAQLKAATQCIRMRLGVADRDIGRLTALLDKVFSQVKT